MSAGEAARKQALAERVLAALDAGPEYERASVAFWVPGRIEVVGKHTDYAGGRSLVCAVEQGIVVAARPRADRIIRMRDVAHGTEAELALQVAADAPRGHWSSYPATVLHRIARNFPDASRGADIVFASDLPLASGLSSSSALVVATFLTLAALNDLAGTPEYQAAIRTCEDLAAYLGTVENGMSFGALAGEAGVGTFGGSEDHAAILCGTPGAVTQFSFCPLHRDRVVPLPHEYVFVIASSGIVAEKTGAALEAYNRLSDLAREGRDWLRAARGADYPTLAAAVDDALAHGGIAAVSEPLRIRVDQFARESTVIVPQVADALERGDLDAVGRLVDLSQQLAETMLRNQVPETIFLARAARERGAVAASAFGAGFGGSVCALVRRTDAAAFATSWRDAYLHRFPAHSTTANFFLTRAGPPARPLDIS